MHSVLSKAASVALMCRHIGGRRYPPGPANDRHGAIRQYVSSTKSAHASAAFAVKPNPKYKAPQYPPIPNSEPETSRSNPPSLTNQLPSRIPLTLLPTPLPVGESSPLNTHFYPDSSVQHTFSVMDALLKDGYDVHRAARMFEALKKTEEGRSTLDVELYNSFLGSYLTESLKEGITEAERKSWLKNLWTLFSELTSNESKWIVRPNRESFAIALLALIKFSLSSSTAVSGVSAPSGDRFFKLLLQQHVLLYDLMQSPLLQFDIDECSRFLRVAALDCGRADIAMELSKAVADTASDELEGVPDVKPVEMLHVPSMRRILGGKWVQFKDKAEAPGQDKKHPYNLQAMREYLGQVRVGRASLQDDPTARQRLMEESAYMVAAQRWRHQAEEMTHHNVAGWNTQHMKLKKWMWNWYQALKERLDNEIPTLEEEEKLAQRRKSVFVQPDGDAIGPFLRLLSTEKMATMTISELLRYGTSDGGVRTARTAITLGRVVEQEYNAEVALAQRSRGPDPVVLTSEGSLTELAAIRQQARDSEDFTMAIPPDWTQVIRGRVGGFLLNAVIDVATITRRGIRPSTGEEVSEEQPAFAHCYEFLHGRKIGLIKFNPELTEQLSSEPIKDALHPRQLPMLIPPRPWIDVERGAYMYSRTSVMRYKDSLEQSSFLRSASSAGHLESMYAALDVLGSTPWTINRPIFDVVIAVWNSGKQFAKIPPAGLEGEDPVKPDNYETDPKAKRDFVRAMSTSIQKRHENHSMRCDTNYKLEIARAFLGERFYFPHNVDFRGRAYPVPPNLNHMGDDLCRGLLTFADKKALGERGLRWLKIHAANKFGYDKASFEERVTWTMEHLDEIYDSAKKPLDGQRWWLKADDPWQFLASCIELHNALESPNPAEFESSLPVHQDGTCNGLQHYAALGGDGQGARQVNLDVGDRPADVYTFVANMVEKRLDEAAAKGDEKAKWLQGRIARKVVKQTVMTTVYGVTFVGARDQIRKQIEALPGVSISEQESYAMAVYVARLTLSCIGDLFGGAKSIQLWLNKVCALITKSIPPERIDLLLRDKEYAGEVRNAPMKRTYTSLVKEQMTSMIWTTPLGMPVVQPYRKQAKKQIYTSLQSLFIADPNLPMEVSSRKQASAFPPNFIHSLDATHMMLTALGCRDKQLTFASVHDSYWTHAASIDEMSATIRDTFVKLHSADILGNLLLEIQQRYKDYKVPVSLLTTMHLTRPKPTMAEAEEEGAEEDADDSPGNCVALNVARISKEDLARMTSSEEIDLDIGKSGASSDEADAEAEVEENGTSKKRKYATRKLKPLKTRFVNLIDIIPPVPSKGEFDIQKIKDSLYFFS